MNMPVHYRHTQFGTLTVLLLVGFIVLLAVLGFFGEWHPVSMGVLLLFLACLVLFYSLTVEVDAHQLEIRFGIGIVKKRFEIKEIEEAYPARNRWYDGWGIRLTTRGWLYNVSGFDAVELVMSSGKRYRIGTDQPKQLAQVLSSTSQAARGSR
jgi:hypothetical protein